MFTNLKNMIQKRKQEEQTIACKESTVYQYPANETRETQLKQAKKVKKWAAKIKAAWTWTRNLKERFVLQFKGPSKKKDKEGIVKKDSAFENGDGQEDEPQLTAKEIAYAQEKRDGKRKLEFGEEELDVEAVELEKELKEDLSHFGKFEFGVGCSKWL